MRNENTFTENGILMDVLRMSYISPCGAKRSPGLLSHITIPNESLEYILIADMIIYYQNYHVCVSDCS